MHKLYSEIAYMIRETGLIETYIEKYRARERQSRMLYSNQYYKAWSKFSKMKSTIFVFQNSAKQDRENVPKGEGISRWLVRKNSMMISNTVPNSANGL